MAERRRQRLDSWKAIANYLNRDVRTVIRWEKERRMPVHRVPGEKGHGVFALREEIDNWLRSDPNRDAKPAAIAVLPFSNTARPDQNYVTDGIGTSIISTLSRIPRVRVMAWSTVGRYRGANLDMRQVGRELNATAVVTGKVAQKNSFWQVSVEAVDPADGAQLWAKQYAKPLVDLQMFPTEIAGDILEGLEIHLTGHQKRRLAVRIVKSPEAYDLYLRGRHQFNQFSAESFHRAIERFERAIALEPGYAQAYAEMALCHVFLGAGYGDLPQQEEFAQADAAARKAIELDETLGEAHCALAHASPHIGFDWQFVERELQRAIELNPSYPTAHISYGLILQGLGRAEEGIEEIEWAIEVDPLNPVGAGDLAFHLALAGHTDEAMEQMQKARKMFPEFSTLDYIQGVVYERMGLHKEAIASLEKGVAGNLMHTMPLAVLGYTYAVVGEREKALDVLARLDELAKSRTASHFSKSIIYAGLGEIDKGLFCLEKAYQEKSPWLYFLTVFPWLENLRKDPRFADLVRRVGLPS
jgi:TolB-like protein/Flp pilus assembly protein TadD